MKLLLWFLLSIIPSTIKAQALNYASRFPNSQLYSLKPDVIGLDTMDGTIAAFGDFDGDKFTDIFVLSSDQTSVCVYVWDHQGFSFKQLSQQIQPGFIVTNVVPGDYNYDGHLDVLLMGEQNPEKNSANEIKLQVYLGNGNDTFASEAIKLDSAQGALPIVLDINGDMKTDLLGYTKDTNELMIWQNQAPSSDSLFNLTSASHLFNKTATDRCRWANPHSNAFVDLDGDCLADLVFVCQDAIQIWTHQRDQGFTLAHEASLPKGAGPLTFADVDGDGSIDILFPVCQTDCSIHIVYNQQMGLCDPSQPESKGVCRKAQDLCVADPHFTFDFVNKNTRDYVIYPIESIRMTDVHFRGHLPVPVHAGDYNLDGYPDLLVTTEKGVVLLGSVLCDSGCAKEAVEMARRTFSPVTVGTQDLNIASTQATFFDLDEDGSLDILLLENAHKRRDAGRVPHFIINNFFNDAFFLKGLVSNGVSDAEAYGVNYPGASFKFTVLDTSGTKRSHQISQLSQSGYLSLQTPYCLFGLGRTNNYVEEMFAGVSRHQPKNYLFYEGVIPNSQLVFLPYQPDHVQDSSSWKVELYIKPADYVPWVLVVLVSASVVLAIVAVVLRTMEKREDEMERRKALHIINFDAL